MNSLAWGGARWGLAAGQSGLLRQEAVACGPLPVPVGGSVAYDEGTHRFLLDFLASLTLDFQFRLSFSLFNPHCHLVRRFPASG
jgi:hypothetical protein